MPKTAEFEEKEFESPLYFQLAKQSGLLWTPGQVFEFFFGIDACIQVDDPQIWNILGYSMPLDGLILNDYQFGYVWRALKKTRSLPTFKNNLFIQAKRPEQLKRRTAGQRSKGLRTPFWRFHKRWHQQRALKRLSDSIKHKGLVIYASPAFDTLNDLYTAVVNQDIINKTNFTQVENLENHWVWAYDSPGTIGYGCSKVEKYEEIPLLKNIQLIHENSNQSEKNNKETASETLSILAKEIITIVKAGSEEKNSRMRYLISYLEDLLSLKITDEFRDYLFISKFCELHRLNWYVIG